MSNFVRDDHPANFTVVTQAGQKGNPTVGNCKSRPLKTDSPNAAAIKSQLHCHWRFVTGAQEFHSIGPRRLR